MKWQPYALGALAVVALAVAVLTGAYFQWDPKILVGMGAGTFLGLLLMGFGLLNLRKALKETNKEAALGHAMGGFMLRLVTLVCGTGVLIYTGWGNPAGFVISFFVTVLVYLGVQTLWVQESLRSQPKTV
ncbi:MAG: hypothetical protein IT462_02060 [Planctomycetes bacterium]|nr:hypothetical protein [Planctomycetota bacterium]